MSNMLRKKIQCLSIEPFFSMKQCIFLNRNYTFHRKHILNGQTVIKQGKRIILTSNFDCKLQNTSSKWTKYCIRSIHNKVDTDTGQWACSISAVDNSRWTVDNSRYDMECKHFSRIYTLICRKWQRCI